MDTGDPVNKALNLGQVESGIIMGLGHYKTEKLTWDENGNVNELCGAYTIPTAADLPDDLRVSGSIESMSPKTDFTMKMPYSDYWDSRGVNHFPLGPTVWKLPSGHENTVN